VNKTNEVVNETMYLELTSGEVYSADILQALGESIDDCVEVEYDETIMDWVPVS